MSFLCDTLILSKFIMKKLIISIIGIIVVVAVALGILVAVQPKSLTTSPIDTVVNQITGTHCFSYHHSATKDSPYTTNERLTFTFNGDQVTGNKQGNQSGPDMTNGYEGSLAGILEGNKITADYAYTVEGSKNKEQEIYVVTQTGIDKRIYPLIDHYKNGLVPDTTKPFTTRSYQSVACESLPNNLNQE